MHFITNKSVWLFYIFYVYEHDLIKNLLYNFIEKKQTDTDIVPVNHNSGF